MLNTLAYCIDFIERINNFIGKAVSWLTLGCVLNCFLVVILRYIFSTGYPWMQELYVWQHSVVFLGGAGFTLLHQGHVKVDIAYNRFSPKIQCWVDIIGTIIFTIPWMVILTLTSFSFITASWAIYEPSPQTNGMQGFFLLKTMIWFFTFTVTLQGVALIGKKIIFLSNETESYSRQTKQKEDHL